MNYKGITLDSRKVEPGYLFAAIKGEKVDGHNYISQAIQNGASGIMLEDKNAISNMDTTGLEIIVSDDIRKTFAEKSGEIFGNPSRKLNLIGITGTKGKTTTSYFLKRILDCAGYKTGMIGTVANYVGDKIIPTNMTTPESNELNSLFSQMIEEGCTHCVMEVSAQGVSQKRIHGLDFDLGIYTNFGSDHLDFYGTKDNYADAKKQFFESLKPGASVVYNSDDPSNIKIINGKNTKFSFGTKSTDFNFETICSNLNEAMYSFNGSVSKISFPGKFNVYNAAAALSTASILDIDPFIAQGALATFKHIPGRFQRMKYGKKDIIIDFAHNPHSLSSILQTLNEISEGRQIYTVFGCAGESDRFKRPEMASVVSKNSAKVIVTEDESKNEDLTQIINDLSKGLKGKNQVFILDRSKAIKYSLNESPSDAIILLAGMGPNKNKMGLTDEEIVSNIIRQSLYIEPNF